MRLLFSTLALTILLAACSSAEEEAAPPRLAVVDSGNVVVMGPDGSNRIEITDGNEFYFQPVWSPDAEMLAFSRISSQPQLNVAGSDGEDLYSVSMETLPFYYSWSEEGDLALLRNDRDGLVLERTQIADGELAVPESLDEGAPLYFSWSPDGSRMATHIGADRLELHDLSEAVPLGPDPGSFQAPAWIDQGIVAIERGSTNDRLTLIAPGEEAAAVASVLGPALFVAAPDGSRVALQTTLAGRDGVSAAFQALPNLPANRLLVVDLATGEHEAVTEDPVIAFFWSPTGERLLILDVLPSLEAQWSLWSDQGLEAVIVFEPDGSFVRDFLPFFDQYAQSVSLWAPDGSAFAFPGAVDGESGIWVQQIGGELDRVSDGTWVSWSP
jgi:TolB protein